MRKIIVFLVFMNLLLLGGGQYLNANTLDSHHHNLAQKHRVKFTNQDKGTSIIEDADLDIEEDLLGSDDIDTLTNKFFAASYSLVDTLYLALSDQSAANDSTRLKISTPFFGHSNPIYITQRVLRI